jgi:hypothetical protein
VYAGRYGQLVVVVVEVGEVAATGGKVEVSGVD